MLLPLLFVPSVFAVGLLKRDVSSGLWKRVDGSSTGSGIAQLALSDDKQSYYTLVTLGRDINFRITLDTASADLWILSSACTSPQCTTVPRYPLDWSSPTFAVVDDGKTAFNASYADTTSVNGHIARQTVQVAGLSVPNQAFGLIETSDVPMSSDISGILGLGFPRLSSISASAVNGTPFFASLAQNGTLDYPMFGVSLTTNDTGSLTLGAIDASVVSNISHIAWNKVIPFSPFGAENNVSSYLHWAIDLTALWVGTQLVTPEPTYSQITAKKSIALFDMGTSGIYGPWQDVSRLFSLIEGSRLVDLAGQWAIPCTTTNTLTLTFGNHNYTLLPEDYIIGKASGNLNLCLSWPRALPPSSDGIDWQIGDAFLRTVYSIFSFGINTKESPMIGLYPLHTYNLTPTQDPLSTPAANFPTLATTLPNFPIATPSHTTPFYALDTSIPASSAGQIVRSELATRAYTALFTDETVNATAIPVLRGLPDGPKTFIVTKPDGAVETQVSSSSPRPSVALGRPPGYVSQSGVRGMRSADMGVFVAVLCVWTLFYY